MSRQRGNQQTQNPNLLQREEKGQDLDTKVLRDMNALTNGERDRHLVDDTAHLRGKEGDPLLVEGLLQSEGDHHHDIDHQSLTQSEGDHHHDIDHQSLTTAKRELIEAVDALDLDQLLYVDHLIDRKLQTLRLAMRKKEKVVRRKKKT